MGVPQIEPAAGVAVDALEVWMTTGLMAAALLAIIVIVLTGGD